MGAQPNARRRGGKSSSPVGLPRSPSAACLPRKMLICTESSAVVLRPCSLCRSPPWSRRVAFGSRRSSLEYLIQRLAEPVAAKGDCLLRDAAHELAVFWRRRIIAHQRGGISRL